MGIEIIRLGNQRSQLQHPLDASNLARPSFQTYAVREPAMSIWLMSASAGRPPFPWWNYEPALEADITSLNGTWAVNGPQSLFDCLFLSRFKSVAGSNVYFILPGLIRAEGWNGLREAEKSVYQRGQGCVYYLQGELTSKLAVNWVPFWQPQSLVKDISFPNLWRLFNASRTGDLATSLSFFSLSRHRLLPEVVNLLIEKDAQRSEKLAAMVDWFGFYSSPSTPKQTACAVVYAGKKEALAPFADLQEQFKSLLDRAQSELLAEIHPRTALRLLSRQVSV